METTLRVVNCPCCMKMLYALGLDKGKSGACWHMTQDSPQPQKDAEGNYVICNSCNKRVAIEELSRPPATRAGRSPPSRSASERPDAKIRVPRDYKMPEINGQQLIHLDPDLTLIPVMFLTASATKDVIDDLEKSGAASLSIPRRSPCRSPRHGPGPWMPIGH